MMRPSVLPQRSTVSASLIPIKAGQCLQVHAPPWQQLETEKKHSLGYLYIREIVC